MPKDKNKWPKQISVDKRIVKILSEQTYENFPNAIKEIITNSYDADSTRVDLKLNLKSESVTIEDNGKGMNEDEFNLYIRIAGQRRERKEKTPSGRYIIGQFGVGFLSVFPFFKTFTIETKKKNTNEVLYASVPCYKYFLQDKIIDITDIDIQGGIKFDNSRFSENYTKIILSGFTQICSSFFYPTLDIKKRKHSISSFDSITKFKWKLCEDLPIEYEDSRFSTYSSYFSPNLPFRVYFNSEQLFRKIYGKIILEESKEIKQIGKIKFRYFISTDKESVTPYEARHLKIRNLNVGVGERTSFGLGTEVGGARSRLHWLTGEIHLLDGLNELITVSRDGFNFHPDYEKLKEFFIVKLAAMSTRLEKEAELHEFVKESKQETRIKNLKLLSPKSVKQTIVKIGKKIDTDVSAAMKQVGSKEDPFQKKMKIKNKTYKVVLEIWDLDDFFPAIKIDGSIIRINNAYSLFKGVKYTDLFIKFHILLLLSFQENRISRSVYEHLINDISEMFSDYKK